MSNFTYLLNPEDSPESGPYSPRLAAAKIISYLNAEPGSFVDATAFQNNDAMISTMKVQKRRENFSIHHVSHEDQEGHEELSIYTDPERQLLRDLTESKPNSFENFMNSPLRQSILRKHTNYANAAMEALSRAIRSLGKKSSWEETTRLREI